MNRRCLACVVVCVMPFAATVIAQEPVGEVAGLCQLRARPQWTARAWCGRTQSVRSNGRTMELR